MKNLNNYKFNKKLMAGLFLSAFTLLSPVFAGYSFADQSSSPSGYIWGLPHGTNTVQKNLEHTSPTAVKGIPNPVVQVVATNSDYYALDNTGAVWAWGAANEGELGNSQPTKTHYILTPTQVLFPAGVTIASLTNTMPDATGMAIDTNGNVWGWGYNNSNELCVKSQNIFTPVMVPISNVTLASGAGDHGLYYSNGILYACGGNANGDLGAGLSSPYTSAKPVVVSGLPSEPISNLTTSWHNSGALMNDGTYYDWGFNGSGQLGNGTTTDSNVPVSVTLPQTATQVSLGGSLASNGQTIALLSDGSVWMWGNNSYGQLGNGTYSSSTTPVPVSVPNGVTFALVDSGGAAAYAIDTTGNTWAWGQNNDGQLGIGGKASSKTYDLPVSLNLDLTEISSTAYNVYGL
jgi:alpha-tubulin suppressor-like RCC1 family protein